MRTLLEEGGLDLAPIGSGRTAERWRALHDLARDDVSVARLAEAHVDAVQILAEAGRAPDPGCLLGVWASEGRAPVVAEGPADGKWSLRGSKGFCGGAGLVDQALVTVRRGGGHHLALVATADLGPRIDSSGWVADALADTSTAVVDLSGLTVAGDDLVGGDRWYLERRGFWHGAIGPAACWAGAAAGLVAHARSHLPDDAHARAHLGAMDAAGWACVAALDRAGREIDAGDDGGEEPRRRALMVRHIVDRASEEIQERFARALGPRPLVADADVIRRDGALRIYRRQCHAERDLEDLGAIVAATGGDRRQGGP